MSDAGAIWLERPGYYVFEKEASEERVCLTCFGKFRTRLRLNRFCCRGCQVAKVESFHTA